MKIMVSPDSFKGSLDAIEVAKTMRKAILDVSPRHEVVMKPMADGGEGTIDALVASTVGERISVTCTGPLGKRIDSNYVIIHNQTAVIEVAKIAGLTQVPLALRNPEMTTSFGLGEVILDALDKQCTSFIIGLGGSATNDCGLGMLLALGMRAWDREDNEVHPYGESLFNIKQICFNEMDPRLAKSTFEVACDVDNPLCGKRGASEVFGPQKGATAEQVKKFDHAFAHFANQVELIKGKSIQNYAGAGAAGGLGFALLAIGGNLVSGARLIADAIEVEETIEWADLILTGEGQSDEQTLYGKAPGYIASLAKQYQVPIVLISGSLTGDLNQLNAQFSSCFSIVHKPLTLKECMDQTEELVYEQVKQIIRFADAVHFTST